MQELLNSVDKTTSPLSAWLQSAPVMDFLEQNNVNVDDPHQLARRAAPYLNRHGIPLHPWHVALLGLVGAQQDHNKNPDELTTPRWMHNNMRYLTPLMPPVIELLQERVADPVHHGEIHHLQGVAIYPAQATLDTPMVVYTGGMLSDVFAKNAEHAQAVQAFAIQHNAPFATFNFAGHGQSEGEISLSGMVADATAMFKHLAAGRRDLFVVASSASTFPAVLAARNVHAELGRLAVPHILTISPVPPLKWVEVINAGKEQADGRLCVTAPTLPRPLSLSAAACRDIREAANLLAHPQSNEDRFQGQCYAIYGMQDPLADRMTLAGLLTQGTLGLEGHADHGHTLPHPHIRATLETQWHAFMRQRASSRTAAGML